MIHEQAKTYKETIIASKIEKAQQTAQRKNPAA